MPYLDDSVREKVFASDGLSPIERNYADAFKDATARGETSRGAHFRALEAVRGVPSTPPEVTLRRIAGDLVRWARGQVRDPRKQEGT